MRGAIGRVYSQATTRDGAVLGEKLCSSFLEPVAGGTGGSVSAWQGQPVGGKAL